MRLEKTPVPRLRISQAHESPEAADPLPGWPSFYLLQYPRGSLYA